MKGGKYENIPSLVENLVEHASVTISWWTGLGADLSDVGLMGGSSVKRTHRPKGGSAIGPHLMKVLNGAILVNHESKRFCNEMDTRDVVSAAILKQTKGEAFLIFDQSVRKSLASIETYANQHLLKEGATVAELAKAIGIPAADLEATLNRYNAQQKAGTDEDFGSSAAQMTASLETAPYYAVCVTPAIHHTMGGLSVNTDTQVLKADGTPIPGLYAAGEVTGGLHGANRLCGNGVADIVVNGRLAGIAAAQKALK